MSSLSTSLLAKHKIISDQIEPDELICIIEQLESVLANGIDGDVVEFGCYEGTTSLFMQRTLDAFRSKKRFYVYDSFDGLPNKTKEDESPLGIDFKRGELRATKAQLVQNFRRAGLRLPIITKKWFHEVEPHELPERICFAFLDGDYYRSIRTSLELVLPRMQNGGVIIIDDYDNPALPGAKKAVHAKGLVNNIETLHGLGIIKKSLSAN